MADLVPSMLAYWDRELRCRFANAAVRDWLGVDPQALLSRRATELQGSGVSALDEPRARAALDGVAQQFEREVRGPGGVRRSLTHYLPDIVDGDVQGFAAQDIDVTVYKRAEERLRSSRGRTARAATSLRRRERALREAQRLSQVGSWEWDARDDAVIWSDELFRIFGRDPLQPPPPYGEQDRLYLPASWSRLRSAVDRAMADGTPYELELEFWHADGSTRWIDARGEAVRTSDGSIVGLRGTAHDITLKRRLDEARVRMEVAEAANRHKTELLSRVTHELRTPLHAILGLGQLLQRETEPQSRHHQWADVIVDNGRHMLALSDDLLDLSAAETGHLTVVEEPVDLELVIEQVCAASSVAAAQAGIELDPMPVPGPWRLVRGDPLRVRQVATNLVSNAIKYGRPHSQVRLWVAASPPDLRCLHVEDQGPGIEPSRLDQLFLPFERLGAERTGVRGAGLGLALSQHLAQRMGGRLEVRSLPGTGSRFTLVLHAA